MVRAEALDAARRAMSENSWRALRADLKVFARWAKANDLASLPASPQTVVGFLRDQAGAGKKAATLSRYASSIARAHALADFADPTKAELVRLELKAQRRALGVRQMSVFLTRRTMHWRDFTYLKCRTVSPAPIIAVRQSEPIIGSHPQTTFVYQP